MAYPWINLLASLFIASSLHPQLPGSEIRTADNLIQSAITSLNQQVKQTLEADSRDALICRSVAGALPDLAPISSKNGIDSSTGKQKARQGFAPNSTVDSLLNLREKRYRDLAPSGCLIVRIEADSPAIESIARRKTPAYQPSGCLLVRIRDNSPVRKSVTKCSTPQLGGCLIVRIEAGPHKSANATAVKASLASTRKLVTKKRNRLPATSHQDSGVASGSYLFRIEETASTEMKPSLSIDPRVLPNYQFIQDPYWQYYRDCDQWNIVFNVATDQPVSCSPASTNQSPATLLSGPCSAMQTWWASWSKGFTINPTYQESILSIVEQFSEREEWTNDRPLELADNRDPVYIRASESFMAGTVEKNQLNQISCWSYGISATAHWALHKALTTEWTQSPDQWLSQQVVILDQRYGETLPAILVKQLSRSWQKQREIKRKKEAESEMKRGFATQIHWLSSQLRDVANAIEGNSGSSREVLRQNEEPVQY